MSPHRQGRDWVRGAPQSTWRRHRVPSPGLRAEAWVAELEQRARDVRSGSVASEDWEVVKAALAERWGRR